MSRERYDPRVIDALADALEKHSPAFHNSILQEVARMLGIEPDTAEPDIDLNGIDWRTRDGEPASPKDEWAWAFAYTREGEIKPETNELVEAIKRHGSVKVDDFEVKLGGRDGTLLNRRRRSESNGLS